MPQATKYSQYISDFTVTKKHWKSQGDENGLLGLYSDFSLRSWHRIGVKWLQMK